MGLGRSGWIDAYRGDLKSAVDRFKIALDLAPQDPLAFNNLVGIGCAYFAAGNYTEAARWQERALNEHPSASWVHRTLCPAYVLAGAKSEARRSLGALRKQYPQLTLSKVQHGLPRLPKLIATLLSAPCTASGSRHRTDIVRTETSRRPVWISSNCLWERVTLIARL